MTIFQNFGSTCNSSVSSSCSVHTQENAGRVKETVIDSSVCSARCWSAALSLSGRNVHLIRNNELTFHPQRFRFYNNCKTPIKSLFWVQLSLHILLWTNYVWPDTPPALWLCQQTKFLITEQLTSHTEFIQKPPHGVTLTVWYGKSVFGITGLYFSEANNCTVTAASQQYQIMFKMLELTAENWFQQDRASKFSRKAR